MHISRSLCIARVRVHAASAHNSSTRPPCRARPCQCPAAGDRWELPHGHSATRRHWAHTRRCTCMQHAGNRRGRHNEKGRAAQIVPHTAMQRRSETDGVRHRRLQGGMARARGARCVVRGARVVMAAIASGLAAARVGQPSRQCTRGERVAGVTPPHAPPRADTPSCLGAHRA